MVAMLTFRVRKCSSVNVRIDMSSRSFVVGRLIPRLTSTSWPEEVGNWCECGMYAEGGRY
jgi:hypothetical protein